MIRSEEEEAAEMVKALHRLKVSLVRAFHWSLAEIAATSIDSLFGFLDAYAEEDGAPSGGGGRRVGAENVAWM